MRLCWLKYRARDAICTIYRSYDLIASFCADAAVADRHANAAGAGQSEAAFAFACFAFSRATASSIGGLFHFAARANPSSSFGVI